MGSSLREFRLLGPIEVWRDGRQLRLGGVRQRTLLAALLLHTDEPVAPDRLIDEMWGEDAPETANKVLQNAVSQLRKLLGADVLVTEPGGYRLVVDPSSVDLLEFQRLVGEGRLHDALALWRGAALADAEDTLYVAATRAHLEELRLAALEQRIDADLTSGASAELVAELEALVAQHPLRERLRGQLMLALYRSGRQADALRVYRETRQLLVDELGIEPGPALRQLQQAILVQDPALDVERAPVRRATRKTVSAVVVELVAEGDVEAVQASLAELRAVVRDIFARHGATAEQTLGGVLLALFGIPAVHEDDPLRAAEATLVAREAVRRHGFALRAGVATGEVLVDESGATGEPIDEADRLRHTADVDEIVLAAATCRLLGDTVEVAEGSRLVDVVPGASFIPRRFDTPFVGRDAELAQLRGALARAPALVSVSGPAGIGKSRLVAAFADAVRDDAHVLVARCRAYGGGALTPIADVIDVPDGDVEETFRAVRKSLEQLAPVVLVVEDVHWAEPTLLELVEHVVERTEAAILVVCLTRPDLEWREHDIALGALSAEESRVLIEHLAEGRNLADETLARVGALAEGNPLFLEQLVALVRERGPEHGLAVPPTVEGLLAARLDLLPAPERGVLERAAAIGREFTRDAVIALSPPAERDDVVLRLHALVRSDLIRPRQNEFEFRHALLRQAAYESTPKRVRADLHEQLAALADESDELAGRHLDQAAGYRAELDDEPGRVQALRARATQRLAIAGRRAYARADIPAALALLSRAAELVPPSVELLVDLAEAQREHGDLERAEQTLADAAATAGAEPASDAAVRLARWRLRLQVDPAIDVEELAGEAARAIAIFEPLGDDRHLAKAWELAAWSPWFRCQAAAADDAATRAVEHARRARDVRTEAQSLHLSIGAAYFGPSPVQAGIERCERILERAELSRVRASALRALAGLTALQGDFGSARSLAEQHRAMVADFGLRVTAASASETYGLIELLAGDDAAAEVEFRQGFSALEALGERSLSAILAALVAHALHSQGRDDEALRFSDLSERSAGAEDVLAQVQWRTARAKVVGSEALAREAIAILEPTDFLVARGDALCDLAEVLRARGKLPDADAVAADAVRTYEEKGALAPSRRARALLAQA